MAMGTCGFVEILSLGNTLTFENEDVIRDVRDTASVENSICIIHSCREIKKLSYAKCMHAFISLKNLEAHRTVGNHLVPMFGECGSVFDAEQAFNQLAYRNVHSWTNLMLAYIALGIPQHALNLYQKMQEDGVHPSTYTVVAVLKACGRLKNVKKGRQIHVEIINKGFEENVFIGSTLIDMYAKCGSLTEAQHVFDKLPMHDVVAWTALIAGYLEHGRAWEALKYFELMQFDGISPNAVSFVCILKACAGVGAIEKGREIHIKIAEKGFESFVSVSNTLIDMYAKCGSLVEALKVFDHLKVRDVVTWNTIIAGYAENGSGQEALKCFDQMQLEEVPPNAVTFACSLKACGAIRAAGKGREIQMKVAHGGLEKDLLIGSILVDMHVKCGLLLEARHVFDKLPIRDAVSWTGLIAGYAEKGCNQEALECFDYMQLEGVPADIVTFTCSLKACASIGAIDKGREIHKKIIQEAFWIDLVLGNALIDMYATCGALVEAQEVFNNLQLRNAVSWNTMIRGYGMNQEASLAVQCFDIMEEEGFEPDATTFIGLLTACSRANLVFKGREYFKLMKIKYGLIPSTDHYTCMIDLLARSGNLCEAEELLQSPLCPPSKEAWRALLGACKTYGAVESGFKCFDRLMQVDPNASCYVLVANTHTDTAKSFDAHRIQHSRKHAGAKKRPARPFIEIDKEVHEFYGE